MPTASLGICAPPTIALPTRPPWLLVASFGLAMLLSALVGVMQIALLKYTGISFAQAPPESGAKPTFLGIMLRASGLNTWAQWLAPVRADGAGAICGGGFMMIAVPSEQRFTLMRGLERFGGRFYPFNFTEQGAQSWKYA